MQRFRKILFWIFTAVYAVGCPMVILNTLGVTFNPETHSIEETGAIHLTVLPADADVAVDGRSVSSRTPVLIDWLSPGVHRLTVQKDGYRAWERKIAVARQQAVTIESLLLIPDSWETYELNGEFDDLIPLNRDRFLLQQGQRLSGLSVYDEGRLDTDWGAKDLIHSDHLRPLLPAGSPLADIRILNIHTRPDSGFLILEAKENRSRQFLWCDPSGSDPTAVHDISPLIVEEPDALVWAPDDDKYIYTRSRGTVSRISVRGQTIKPDILTGIKSLTASGDVLYAVTDDNRLRQYDRNGESGETLLDDPELTKHLFAEATDIDMTVPYPGHLMVFLTAQGRLMLNHLPHVFVDDGVTGTSFDRRRRQLLFWTASRLGFIDLNPPGEETLFERGPVLTWLPDPPFNQIRSAVWANGGRNILVSTHDRVYITAVESYGQTEYIPVTEIRPDSAIVYAEDAGVLFFLTPSGRPAAIRIIPEGRNLPVEPESPNAVRPEGGRR